MLNLVQVSTVPHFDATGVAKAADRLRRAHLLIKTTENLLLSDSSRASASASLAALGAKDREVLNLIFILAKQYAEHQSSIADADPYFHNGIEIVSHVKNHDSSIVEFLVVEIIRKYEGIPRWTGIRSLARIGSSQAKKAIESILDQSDLSPHDLWVVKQAIAEISEQ